MKYNKEGNIKSGSWVVAILIKLTLLELFQSQRSHYQLGTQLFVSCSG